MREAETTVQADQPLCKRKSVLYRSFRAAGGQDKSTMESWECQHMQAFWLQLSCPELQVPTGEQRLYRGHCHPDYYVTGVFRDLILWGFSPGSPSTGFTSWMKTAVHGLSHRALLYLRSGFIIPSQGKALHSHSAALTSPSLSLVHFFLKPC